MIDTVLTPDPDADQELGADVEALTDNDVRGSRLLLVRRGVESIEIDGKPAGLVQLACTFQPADGARFASAQFRLRFKTPEGLRIIDLAPRVIDDPHPVELTLNRKGQLAVKAVAVVEPSVEISASKTYVRYHCMVQGSGEGTNLARWDFRENPDRRDGIGREQVITVTLPVTGTITGEVLVSARLARHGLGGAVDAIRDMILGPRSDERSHPIALTIPAQPSSGLERLLHFF
ncbi:MAG TPA: hypothetical protein VFN10_19510 [Thermoanaerobaculia bacterium]|nr:hypothetical protein [Thermoanaerobaculia bacterium]